MVLRIPKTLDDRSLLVDEPFGSHFARRIASSSKELRRRKGQSPSPFFEQIEAEMRTEGTGLDAAILWLRFAFQVDAEEAARPAMLHIFIEFYWLLACGKDRDAEALLQKECKARKFLWRTDMSKKVDQTQMQLPRTTNLAKRPKRQPEDVYDAEPEDNSSSFQDNDIPNSLIAIPTSGSSCQFPTSSQTSGRLMTEAGLADPTSTEPKTKGRAKDFRGKGRGKKRKAKKAHPSSPSATSGDDVPLAHAKSASTHTDSGVVPLDVYMDWDSPLTSLASDDSHGEDEPEMNSALISSSPGGLMPSPIQELTAGVESLPSATPQPVPGASTEQNSAPLAELDLIQQGIPAPTQASPMELMPAPDVKSPFRQIPHRRAANRQKLSSMMEAELKHEIHLRRRKKRLVHSSSESDLDIAEKVPTNSITKSSPSRIAAFTAETPSGTQVLSTKGLPAAAKERKLAQGKRPKVPGKEITTGQPFVAEDNSPVVGQIHCLDTIASPSGAQDETQADKASHGSSTVPLPHRLRTAKKPRIFHNRKGAGVETQIAKRRRGNDGMVWCGHLAQTMMACSKVHRDKPSSVSNGPVNIEAPPPKPVVSNSEKTGRKRDREEEDNGSILSEGLMQNVIVQKSQRKVAPLPKHSTLMKAARKRCIPAPKHFLPPTTQTINTLPTMDSVIRDAAIGAHQSLNSVVDQASDWEVDEPDDHLIDESSEENIPLSTENSRNLSSSVVADLPEITDIIRGQSQVNAREEIIQCSEPIPIPSILPGASTSIYQVISPRPPLSAYPPIWSQSRQEVCESFDWFRSYQGGVYFVKDLVKGYLLSAFSASRDIFYDDGKLIISHGGGRAESLHKSHGQIETHQATDQLEDDKSVRALLRTYRMQRPLALLIDDKYALFPFDLSSKGCTYVILGWYYIAHAWAEYQSASNSDGRVIRYKFAFRWCAGQGDPWWSVPDSLQLSDTCMSAPISCRPSPLPSDPENCAAEVTPDSLQNNLHTGPPSYKCQTCNHSSEQVYAEGWLCLRAACKAFWKTSDGQNAPDHLNYALAFLQPTVATVEAVEDLRPSLPVSNIPEDGITTSRHFCKGWHCRNCGRLSSRYKWEHWECRSCGETFGSHGKPRLASEFRMQTHAKSFDRHAIIDRNIMQCPYKLFRCERSHGAHVTFILPNGRGRIHLLLSPPIASDVADSILHEYQEQARTGELRFRRWPLRSHKCRGTLLTNYFSQNTGEPYQYVGGADNTVTWSDAPTAVTRALGLIQQRMKEASLDETVTFNEVLTAAYMEKQKMAFHSDSERGLGPVVASLSLGASAYMHFRLHSQYANSEIPDGHSRDVLTLFLRHGDVVVMEGADVQTYYEHTVVPLNFRIAATARFIGSDHH